MSDRDKVVQVLDNLMSNALKFTDNGSVTLIVKKEGDFVRLSVKDTGIGLDTKEHERVFEQFSQVGDVLTAKPKGTGLGLPLCKVIVEYYGGTIQVRGKPGKGCCFSFTLPLSV